MKQRTSTVSVLLIALTLMISGLYSCKNNHQTDVPDVAFSTFIKAYTGDRVTSSSSIRIEFTSDVPEQPDPAKILSFSPSIKGQGRWDTPKSLIFIPYEGQLEEGRRYTAKLKLDGIYEISDPSMKEFTFGFKVMQKQAVMTSGTLVVSSSSPELATVRGEIRLNEDVKIEEIRKSVSIGYPVKGASVEISGEDKASIFTYTVSGIEKGTDARTLTVSFDGKSNGIDTRTETKVEIPAKDAFKVFDSQYHQEAEKCIEVTFTNPLPSDADMEGLIGVTDAGRQYYQIEDNVARVYFEQFGNETPELVISSYLKDIDGTELGEEYRETFENEDIKPQVKIPLKGNILPDSDNLTLTFSAVSLRAVDLSVIKIYEDNILSFLQENNLSGSYSLRRSGRMIYKTTLRLDSNPEVNLHKWQDYTVGLEGLFRKEPGAIYRIIIRFNRDYSVYGERDSQQQYSELPLVNLTAANNMTQEEEDIWDEPSPYYYFDDGFDWREYDWRDIDNPLKPTYYTKSDIYGECNLIATDLGLIVKSAENGRYYVNTNSIMTADPVKGAEIKAYNYQLREIGKATTDAKGMAILETDGRAFIITAEKNGSKTYLRIVDGEENSTSRFDTGGTLTQKGLKAYIYGERGVWRPGDTLYLTMVLGDRDKRIPDSHPVTMELYNPMGQLHSRTVCAKGMDGFYRFVTSTSADDPTGTWNAYFKVGGAAFHKALHIETIKPNRLKVNLELPEAITSEQNTRLGISANWLTGPAASGLRTRVTATLRKAGSPFKGFEKYTFSNPLSEFTSSESTVLETVLDNDGKASVTRQLANIPGAPGMLSATFLCTVAEPGGDESITSVTVPLSPYPAYVGIRTQDDILVTDTDYKLDIAVLDHRGKAVKGHRIEYTIYKLEWRWWWESKKETLDSYVNGRSAQKIASGMITSSGKDAIPFKITYPDWGKYLVLVKDIDGGHTSGDVISVDWPEWRGRSEKNDPDGLAMITFSTDKDSYAAGEKATVYVPAAKNGKALISIENASKVLFRDIVATDAGNDTPYTFTVTEDMAPNSYIHMTLLQPYGENGSDLPVRLYGITPVNVNNPQSHLYPEINAPEVIRPQEEFTVNISEKNGRAMTYTLAIVDEGLLDITGFRTPDPWSEMYAREALGVRTWDIYDNVIYSTAGKLKPMFSIGGDAYFADKGKRDNRFNPVVKFLGPFTSSNGKGSHKITLPMYVGSVRIMLVAGNGNSYGNAEKTVPVRSPLMVLPTLPRILSTGDVASLPVNIFTMEDNVRNVKINVRTEGPVRLISSASQTVAFDKPGDALSEFRLAAGNEEGTATIIIEAEGAGYKVSETVSIAVRNPNPRVTEVQSMLIGKGRSNSFRYPASSVAQLTLTNFPSVDFNGCYTHMKDYPYSCSEQIASRGLALLNIQEFMGETERKEIGKTIPELLEKLYQRQLPDGGFSYWPGSGVSNEWVSSMAGELFITAMKAGYEVNQGVRTSWINFQKQASRNYRRANDMYNEMNQAYRLYTLALASRADLGAMNRMKEAGVMDPASAYLLSSAYALAGKKNIAAQIVQDLSLNTTYNGVSNPVFGTDTRDMAIAVKALMLSGMTGKALEYASEMAESFNAGGHFISQETAFCTSALKELASGISTGVLKAEISCSGTEEASSSTGRFTKTLDACTEEVTIKNTSDGPIYASLLSNSPAPSKTEAASSGLSLDIRYFDMDGNLINPNKVRQGDRFYASVAVSNTDFNRSIENIALIYRIPSGWEIFNTRLYGVDTDVTESQSDYRDIRDDSMACYFSLAPGETKKFTIRLNATYKGVFVFPAASCEAMYAPSVFARTASGTAEVTDAM